MLLHGNPRWGYLYRNFLAPLSGRGHRVIVPDLLGAGRSESVSGRTSTESGRSSSARVEEDGGVKVFVAGGTGVIGRRLLPQLVAAGHQVTATTRRPEKAELLASLGATPAVLDALDGLRSRESG